MDRWKSAVLTTCLACSTMPSPVTADAYRFRTDGGSYDATWTGRFDVPENPGFQGTDSTYSIPLGGSTRKLGVQFSAPSWSMFTGGDTFVGWSDTSRPRRRSRDARGNGYFQFAPNTLSLFEGAGDGSMRSLTFQHKGLPTSDPGFLLQRRDAVSMVPNTDTGLVRWPADGTVVNHGYGGTWLVQFWSVVEGLTLRDIHLATWLTAPISANSHPYQGDVGGSWRISSPGNLFAAPSGPYTGPRVMGNAVLNLATDYDAFASDGYVYVYGIQEAGAASNKHAFVARAKATELHDPSRYQFWTGSFPDAPNRIEQAQPLRDVHGATIVGLASEFGVFQLPNGHFALLYIENDGIDPKTWLPESRPRILVRTTTDAGGKSPAGPWSDPTVLGTLDIPASGNATLGLPDLTVQGFPKDSYFAYGAKPHPQYSRLDSDEHDGELLVSVNLNGNGPGLSAFVLTDIYRPRFFRFKFYRERDRAQ